MLKLRWDQFVKTRELTGLQFAQLGAVRLIRGQFDESDID